MKKIFAILLLLTIVILTACGQTENFEIVTTTLPVYEFTSLLCTGTDLSVGRLVTESISCLHDYTLQVDQMRMIENANVIVISGAGLETFLDNAMEHSRMQIDASINVHIYENINHHDHTHDLHDDHSHEHDVDPHIWLSPENAKTMAVNIASGLTELYPQHSEAFQRNLDTLTKKLDTLQIYGNDQLSKLKQRELITFHDGFAYFAESFDLHILESVEEESGSEASAAEIIHLVALVNDHNLPAVFTERSGSDACAGIISKETGAKIYTLDMAMAGDSYFDALYHNIDTVKEALG